MIVLGIDPGLVQTGWGVLEARDSSRITYLGSGCIRTSRTEELPGRLLVIFRAVSTLIERYKPEIMVLEKLYSHYKHPVTSILMGHARGVVSLAAGASDLRVLNYPATRVKKSVTGNGNASKDQVQHMVYAILGLDERPATFDESDALAIALAYIHMEKR